MKQISLMTLILMLLGCSSSHLTMGMTQPPDTAMNIPARLDLRGSRVLLMAIPDAEIDLDRVVLGSGREMTAELGKGLRRRGMSAVISPVDSIDMAIQLAKSQHCDFVIEAVFSDWRDGSTLEWTQRAHAAISAELYDASTSTLLASARGQDGGSSVSLAADHPSHFFPSIADAIVNEFTPAMIARAVK